MLVSSVALAVPGRVISAGHSITELVLALGGGNNLIAVDSSTRLPADFRPLPVVGYYRHLPAEGLLAQNPQLLVGGNHMGPANTLTLLENSGVEIVQLPEAQSGEQLLENIQRLGEVLGKPAEAVTQSVEEQLASLARARATLTQRPRILFVRAQSGRGLKAAGTGTSPDSLIRLAGGTNVVTFDGYKQLSDEALVELRPDWILFSDDQAEQLRDGAELLVWQPLLKLTPAGKRAAFFAVDGYALLGGLGLASLREAKKLNDKISVDR
ncbi:heme/hemin ABC transporter substrate-binding protein [Microbulbifer agarilyticus]|uniref:heme/hemin ABC transporter substrate-binding protein n=1 Tax=Microbulbifer agarilyticus TaxID=260552 RepID=UPI001CD6A570|nr:ABC transporter substrate-binding protein [Microbulbifer agarilyticus]MCA0899526.1 ABC transporter substrate-binding protein [Microbulbifer agarilyticus]